MLAKRGWYVGNKWGLHRTSLLRQFSYPEFPGERFIPEGLVWNRLAAHHLIRFINLPLRVVEYRADGLTAQQPSLRVASPKGCLLVYTELSEVRAAGPASNARVRMKPGAIRHPCKPDPQGTHGRLRPAGVRASIFAEAGALWARRDVGRLLACSVPTLGESHVLDIHVAAFTGGLTISSSRFRVRQYVPRPAAAWYPNA
jgi:hypothetical protein